MLIASFQIHFGSVQRQNSDNFDTVQILDLTNYVYSIIH